MFYNPKPSVRKTTCTKPFSVSHQQHLNASVSCIYDFLH